MSSSQDNKFRALPTQASVTAVSSYRLTGFCREQPGVEPTQRQRETSGVFTSLPCSFRTLLPKLASHAGSVHACVSKSSGTYSGFKILDFNHMESEFSVGRKKYIAWGYGLTCWMLLPAGSQKRLYHPLGPSAPPAQPFAHGPSCQTP